MPIELIFSGEPFYVSRDQIKKAVDKVAKNEQALVVRIFNAYNKKEIDKNLVLRFKVFHKNFHNWKGSTFLRAAGVPLPLLASFFGQRYRDAKNAQERIDQWNKYLDSLSQYRKKGLETPEELPPYDINISFSDNYL